MEDRTQKLKYIGEYFGAVMQETKMQEEAGELITAISRLQQRAIMAVNGAYEEDEREVTRLVKEVITELADIEILKEQLIDLYDVREEYEEEVNYKIERTLKRIAYGYYE